MNQSTDPLLPAPPRRPWLRFGIVVGLFALLVGLGWLLIGSSPRPTEPASRQLLVNVKHWLYLIDVNLSESTIEKIVNSDYDLVVLDNIPTERNNQDFPMKEPIRRLHAAPKPKLVLAYIDIGQAEDYRTYWQPEWRIGNPDWITALDPDGWEGNYPVAFWRDEWQKIWLGSGGYLERIVAAGFDGVYLDWVEAYSDENIAAAAARDGVDPRQAMIGFVQKIAALSRARNPQFLVIGQNAAELVTDDGYAQTVDAISQEQVWFDGAADNDPPGDCPLPRTEAEVDTPAYLASLSPPCRELSDQYPESTLHVSSESYLKQLTAVQANGLPIFTVDYAVDPVNIRITYETARRLGFIPFVGQRSLDQYQDPLTD